ncbi:MAG TPA: cold shock domain-containing protein [Verrucomicrobiae bacterium]|jgi:CspA family cold shock protein|nr:cold shock domain-containing protein [Verrucomicrobiae bacterium]
MATGKVKWWDSKKGFGFITGSNDEDFFVHHTGVIGLRGKKNLEENQSVAFDPIQSEKGMKAVNVRTVI